MNIISFIKNNKYKILLIAWMSIIFILSSIPNLKSEIPGIDDYILRKLAHFIEYFILMFLCLKAFIYDLRSLKFNKRLIFCVLFCSFYALTDEFHQLFTPTRKFAWFDFGIDNLGLLSCLLTLFIYNKRIKK